MRVLNCDGNLLVLIRGKAMNLKKTFFVSLATLTLLSLETTINSTNHNDKVASASTISRELKHNAAIYTKNGKSTKARYLKKGNEVVIYGYKTLHSKKFAYIGNGKYILVSNLNSSSKKANKKVAKSTNKKAATTTNNESSDSKIPSIYKKWLKNRRKGNLVAIRDTQSGDPDGDPKSIAIISKIRKGDPISIPSDIAPTASHLDIGTTVDIVKGKLGYFLTWSNNYGGTAINLKDFEFKPYDSTYKKLVKKLTPYCSPKEFNWGTGYAITFTPTTNISSLPSCSSPISGTYGQPHTLTAGKRITLLNPDILINGKGQYVLEGSKSDNTYDVPIKQITHLVKPKSKK